MATVITKPCMLCKGTEEVELTDEEVALLDQGELIQVALVNRDEDFRELILTGTHPECWNSMFPEEDEEDDY